LIVFAAIVVGLAFILPAGLYWERIAELEPSLTRRHFLAWVGQGVVAPILLWLALNSGLLPGMPPLMNALGRRFANASGLPALLQITTPALWVVGSCWAAVTFAWLVGVIVSKAENPSDLAVPAVFWFFILIPVACLIFLGCGWWGAGLAATVWLLPMVHNMYALAVTAKPPPMYARAIAKMKFGKYDEAEQDVLQELERCEDDFDGWIMLAEMYANQFGDLPAADRTIHELCDHPNATPSQISVALHRLAEWYLKAGEDPVAARRALEEIRQRLPGTHLAHMAQLRLNQLPSSRDEMMEQRKAKVVRLPALSDKLDEPEEPIDATDERLATRLANQYSEKLKLDANNVPAREEFARILAERLGKVPLACEQVELLLELPDQPDSKRAEWVGLMAAWQLKYQHNSETARELLQRVIREFPKSPQAIAARRRMSLMDTEERMRQARAAASSGPPPARNR
jgi:tetratricopeptide (TPR) repeat protein